MYVYIYIYIYITSVGWPVLLVVSSAELLRHAKYN